ncbi:MAG: rod shape-determining protein RodA [Spirochaetaceae bacterium]|jgi:rod shape determining protein RodA|nr:rod shape-determining protein RodA [Spirochaetaceae bacterium]
MRLKDITEIDFPLLIASIVLTVFGILFIYSSGITSTGELVSDEYIKQIVWGSSGLLLVLFLALIDYRRIYHLSRYLYLGTLALLVYTCVAGRYVGGARAWIGIGGFGVQPSEFAKLTTIIFLAQYLDSSKRAKNEPARFILSCMIVFVPMALILLQPDFGTSLVFIPILLSMTFVAGIATRYIVFMVLCIALSGILLVLPLWQEFILNTNFALVDMLAGRTFFLLAVLLLTLIFVLAFIGFLTSKKKYFYWIDYGSSVTAISLCLSFLGRKVLKDYQIMRLLVFLDPNIDPRGSGWHIIQSMTAIGSGGLYGKGFKQGTQSHYRFLPQQSTDFIFSIFAEEAGLVGGIFVFVLFLLIFFRLTRILKSTSDPFGIYLTTGVCSVYFFHFIINVGMTMGIMPITGIPLLFMSYGGSALLSAMAGIGLCLSVYVRRFQH